jgi:hypothetical protein
MNKRFYRLDAHRAPDLAGEVCLTDLLRKSSKRQDFQALAEIIERGSLSWSDGSDVEEADEGPGANQVIRKRLCREGEGKREAVDDSFSDLAAMMLLQSIF